MSKSSEQEMVATATTLNTMKQSINGDLQYVSMQMDGKNYGGWYRFLADGRMELLALAHMHCERRNESSAIDQARGMLSDFVRARLQGNRQHPTQVQTNTATSESSSAPQRTLGGVIYTDAAAAAPTEADWLRLVLAIAAGHRTALYHLYERAERIVFTLVMRLVADREMAEELTIQVFQNIWRSAGDYDASAATVLGWIMNHARATAMVYLQTSPTLKSELRSADDATDFSDLLSMLTVDERQILESTFFSPSAAHLFCELNGSREALIDRVDASVEKLRHALHLEVE